MNIRKTKKPFSNMQSSDKLEPEKTHDSLVAKCDCVVRSFLFVHFAIRHESSFIVISF